EETAQMNRIAHDLREDGVPTSIPWVISEYGFSAFSGRAMSEPPSALLAADIVGHFLSLGGSAAYMFGYPPDAPINQHLACAGYGNMTPFIADEDGQARDPTPSYWAHRMLTEDWAAPEDQVHRLYAAEVAPQASKEKPSVVAYLVQGAGGRW